MSALRQPLGKLLREAELAPGWHPAYAAWLAQAGPLIERIEARQREGVAVFPADPLRALRGLDPSDCRVVILGQDPYHGPDQAEGLAFSVPAGQKAPPSLRNLLAELQRDLGPEAVPGVHLGAWARAGVLLLNTVLTVEPGQAASHARWGWEALSDALIGAVSAAPGPRAFLLWGAHAQAKRGLIDASRHLVLTANHPSPLAARRPPQPFLGCGHFGLAERWLQAQGLPWSWPRLQIL